VKYRWLRLRSWWYWRRFEKPGRTVTEQAEFARRCYVSQSAVSRWESGRKMPGRRSQLQIADVLKASRQRMFRELLDDGRPERAA